MNFSRIPRRRLRAALAGALVIAGLAACGGGTTQYATFTPQRLLVFGDDMSALTSTGLKYAVNGFTSVDNGDGTTTNVPDCTAIPNWAQTMASAYGFVFAECNPGNVDVPKARMLAAAGATVDDISAQIDNQIAAGGFFDGDLATMLAGANDIIQLYQQFPVRSEADLENELRSRGKALALQINRLVGFGAKVIFITVPDQGLTPYAVKQRNEFTDTDRAALLTRLTEAFNEQLGANVVLDGRYVGLVQGDVRSQSMVRSPSSYGLSNVTDGACLDTAPLPNCDTSTLVDGAGAATWMWADDLRPAFALNQQIATLAIARVRGNPF